MPLDEARVAETRAWPLKAAEDIRAARLDLTTSPPLASDAAFHAQQACEKALKAFLTWHSHALRKTHNLVELGESCASIDRGLEPLLRRAGPLTEYAWRFRYPGDLEAPVIEEVQAALEIATGLLTEINARLGL